jgi:hypothetical protein
MIKKITPDTTPTAWKCQDFAPAHQVPHFLWLQRWPQCGSVLSAREPRLASLGLQVYPEPEGDQRHREEAPTPTPRRLPTDLGVVSPPDTGSKSSLQKFSQFDVSTSGSDSSSQVSGKRGRVWVNSGRRARQQRPLSITRPHHLANYSHDGLSLRQRNTRGDSTGEGASSRRELLFEFAAPGIPHSLFAFCTCSRAGGKA